MNLKKVSRPSDVKPPKATHGTQRRGIISERNTRKASEGESLKSDSESPEEADGVGRGRRSNDGGALP